MKPAKVLHLLLAALLCYGQLAASYHVAGHLYSDLETESQSSHADEHHAHNHGFADHLIGNNRSATNRFTNPKHASHQHNRSAFASNVAGKNADGAANDDDSVEADCELYHALSSLSVVFPQEQFKPQINSRPTSDISYASAHITSLILETNRIRGPPVLS